MKLYKVSVVIFGEVYIIKQENKFFVNNSRSGISSVSLI